MKELLSELEAWDLIADNIFEHPDNKIYIYKFFCRGLCVAIYTLYVLGEISHETSSNMLGKIDENLNAYYSPDHPFMFPKTREGNLKRAHFCREQAEKLKAKK